MEHLLYRRLLLAAFLALEDGSANVGTDLLFEGIEDFGKPIIMSDRGRSNMVLCRLDAAWTKNRQASF